MELISSIGTLIASAATAIAGHFVAHDLYEAAPRHAKRLLNYAVGILPENDRERYAEEWLAHLHECEGVIGKFRHALECLLIARGLRQIFEQRTAVDPCAIEFVFFSKGQMTAKVSMDTTTALPVLMIMEEAEKLERPLKPGAFVPTKEIEELMANPAVKRDKFSEIRDAGRKALASGESAMSVQAVDRFGRAINDNDLKAWVEQNED